MPRQSRDTIEAILIAHGHSQDQAHIAASMSDGIVGKALEWLDGDGGMTDAFFSAMMNAGGNALSVWPLFEQYKDQSTRLMALTEGYLRDILVYAQTQDGKLLMYANRQGFIAEQAAYWDVDQLRSKLRVAQDTSRRLEGNAHYQMTIERMLFNIVEGKTW